MRPIPWPLAVLAAASVIVAYPSTALADPVARGSFSLTNPATTPDLSFTGSVTFDNVTYDVFGTPINFGTDVGTMTISGKVTSFSFSSNQGTFTAHFESVSPGAFRCNVSGSFICAPSGCSSASFVGDLTDLMGSVAASLPSDATYTTDGTAELSGVTYSGPISVNGFRPAPTPVGTSVDVSMSTSFYDSATEREVSITVDVDYASVQSAGSTLVTASSNAAGAIPSNFSVSAPGYQPPFFDVSTDASVSPPITVCTRYADADDDGIVDQSTVHEGDLRMLHNEAGTFVDVTTFPVDIVNNVICGQVQSLSDFVVAFMTGCSTDGECDDSNPCTSDVCAAGVCSHSSLANGTGCNDHDACTQTDTCQGGVCTGTSRVVCTALDQCHDVGTCDPGTGTCSNPNKADGIGCDDHDACTRTDTCQGGVCTGTSRVVCTALDQCHDVGTCDPGTGTCSNPKKADGTACDDGNACTTGDACSNGACAGGPPPDCNDSNVCTDDSCNPAAGCQHTNNTASCNDGLFCNGADTCSGGACIVHSGNPCPNLECRHCNEAADSCFDPVGTACHSDGDVCTADVCDGAGTCQHPPANCDDGNPCTTDSCRPRKGCLHKPLRRCGG